MEDYKKKYEQALERAKEQSSKYGIDKVILEEVFPELKESKDEKIRKQLLNWFKCCNWNAIDNETLKRNDIIAWLEKQGKIKCSDYLYIPGWRENRPDNKPEIKHSILMLTTHGIAEGEWLGKEWCQYRWSCKIKDTQVLYWLHLSDLETLEKENAKQDFPKLEKQGEQKPVNKVEPGPYFYCKYGGTTPLCSDCKRNHINSPFKTEEITTWYIPTKGTKQCTDYIACLEKQVESQSIEGTFVNVDDVRDDFMNEVYRIFDADSTNDRANQIIQAFDSLPTVVIKKPQDKPALDVWKDMRLEVYQQASGNRHEPNYSDDSTKMFSLIDIDEIFEKVAEKQGKQKLADKVEPKFKVGDWVVSPNGVYWHIDAIRDSRYQVSSDLGSCADWPLNTNIYHKFTIQDAKDGDVLITKGRPFLFKGFVDECSEHPVAYCGIDTTNAFYIPTSNNHWTYNICLPATKEQRDLLFTKMKEAGYEWDAEKKKLKDIKK